MRTEANQTQNNCILEEESLVNKQEAGRQPRASWQMLQFWQPENLEGISQALPVRRFVLQWTLEFLEPGRWNKSCAGRAESSVSIANHIWIFGVREKQSLTKMIIVFILLKWYLLESLRIFCIWTIARNVRPENERKPVCHEIQNRVLSVIQGSTDSVRLVNTSCSLLALEHLSHLTPVKCTWRASYLWACVQHSSWLRLQDAMIAIT